MHTSDSSPDHLPDNEALLPGETPVHFPQNDTDPPASAGSGFHPAVYHDIPMYEDDL